MVEILLLFAESRVSSTFAVQLIPGSYQMSHRTEVINYYVKSAIKKVVPPGIYRPLLARWRRPREVPANLLSLLNPVSRLHGLERGLTIDRYYIEKFLARQATDIRDRTLEMGDARYTQKFGGDRVKQSDVLHLRPGNPQASFVGDLASEETLPPETFDCILAINTFLLIYDVRAALHNCYGALKEGGVLLGHFPGICPRIPYDPAWAGDYWRFTSTSVRQLCEEVFPAKNIEIEVYGNVRTATAFLYGLSAEELRQEELDYCDRDYELLITVRAVKPRDKR
jgi:SAM-dependent methyltransferase